MEATDLLASSSLTLLINTWLVMSIFCKYASMASDLSGTGVSFPTVEGGTLLTVCSGSCRNEPSESVSLLAPFLVKVALFRGEDAPFFLLPGVFFTLLGIVIKNY